MMYFNRPDPNSREAALVAARLPRMSGIGCRCIARPVTALLTALFLAPALAPAAQADTLLKVSIADTNLNNLYICNICKRDPLDLVSEPFCPVLGDTITDFALANSNGVSTVASAKAAFGTLSSKLVMTGSNIAGQGAGRTGTGAEFTIDDLIFSGAGCPVGGFPVSMNVDFNGTVDLGSTAFNIATYELDIHLAGQLIANSTIGFLNYLDMLDIGFVNGFGADPFSMPVISQPFVVSETRTTSSSAFVTPGVFVTLNMQSILDGRMNSPVSDPITLEFLTPLPAAVPVFNLPDGCTANSTQGNIFNNQYLPDGQPNPDADAGPDQSVNEGDPVTLDGSGSSDPQGDPLNFDWLQIAGPSVLLDVSDPMHPAFDAPSVDSNVTLTFQLIVDDGVDFSDPDTVDVTVVQANNPPSADAGDDFDIKPGALAELDGTNSFDPEGLPDTDLVFDWTQVAGPGVALDDVSDPIHPTFPAPDAVGQTLVFKLQVSDDLESSVFSVGTDSAAPDTVTVTIVDNAGPSADAGDDQTKDEGSAVTLVGVGSDPDGDPITYEWTQVSGPDVGIDGTTTSSVILDAPLVDLGGEELVFRLDVHDNDPIDPKSATDEVVVNDRNIA